MPEPLASGGQTVFRYRGNITPPKNYRQWKTVVKLLTHWRAFYGAKKLRGWFFEVWNEPNWPAFGRQTSQLFQVVSICRRSGERSGRGFFRGRSGDGAK